MRFALVVGLSCISAIAHADRNDERKATADARYHEGEVLYGASEYLAAAAKFEEAYAFDPDPAILFNIAQAYRLGHACAQAARFYHRFVAEVPNPPEHEKINQYITDMDACARRESDATKPKLVHHRDPGRGKRTLGLVIGAVGVAGLGAGAYLTYYIHQIEADRESICAKGCVWGNELTAIERLDHRGERAELAQAIVYTAAGAALVTGVTLYVFGATRSEVFSVLPARGGATASVRLAF